MERKIPVLTHIASRITENRRMWEEMKAHSPGTTCDEFAYSCEETVQLAAAIGFRGVSCRCIDEARKTYKTMEARKIADEALNRFGSLPSGLAYMTFETFRQLPEWRKHEADSALHALKVCLRYSENRYDLPFLTIFGPVGTGKTHLAMALAQGCDEAVMWANVPDLLAYLRSTFDRDVAASFHQELERINSSRLLVLDDLASERQTEWATEQLYQIINHRHINRLPTVVTTNDDVLKMVGRVGSRIRDFHTGQVVRLDVDDNRLRMRRR